MKKIIITLLLLLPLFVQSQKLTINETITYINKTLYNNSYDVKVELLDDGIIKISQIKKGNGEYRKKATMHWSEVTVSKFSSGNPQQIRFWCKKEENSLFEPNCITVKQDFSPYNRTERSHSFFVDEKYKNDKLYNAFLYLFSELKTSTEYNRNDDDPFAPQNFRENSSKISGNNEKTNIALETYGGVYKVWVKIGHLNKQFVLDSGASEISLSKNTERELIINGIIKKEDYIEPALFKLADGSIIKCRRLLIPEMTIGNYTIKNIRASIGVSDSPLLLGRSFLDNFKKWSIDNDIKELILEK